MTMKFTKLAACSVLILSSAAAMAADMEKKGVTPYVTLHLSACPEPRHLRPWHGDGKYKGITGSEPFACNGLPAQAGDGGYTSMDIPHNTSWEIK